jgi:transcription antitermination factor NusG
MTESHIDPWLVLRTRSHQENTVERCLRQKQIYAYLPRHQVLRRRANGPRTCIEMPLFPGYIFVQPSVDQFEHMRYIRGSCGLILSGDKPAVMPEKDLEAVRILVDSGMDLAASPRLMPGQRVEVVDGPFMGIQGELIRIKSVDRLVINAPLLSSSVSVEVDAEHVISLEPRKAYSAVNPVSYQGIPA